MNLYTDGSGWNGRKAECVVTDENGKILNKLKFSDYTTNNEAEYYGLLLALEIAQNGDIIYSDSSLVINQIKKRCRCNKDHLKKLRDKCINILKEKKTISLYWISGEENIAGRIFER